MQRSLLGNRQGESHAIPVTDRMPVLPDHKDIPGRYLDHEKSPGRNDLSEIKPAYLGALMCLWTDEGIDEMLGKFGNIDGMKLIELGRCAGLEPSTMTGLIDRMERDGLLHRSNDPHDRRAQIAMLTEKGIMVRSRVLAAMDEMFREAFTGIDAEKLETVKEVLRKIMANANKG